MVGETELFDLMRTQMVLRLEHGITADEIDDLTPVEYKMFIMVLENELKRKREEQ